jgi:hypothetical protein
MPLARHFSRRRLCLAAALLAVAVLAAAVLLTSWGTKSAERARYERIEAGMDREQVKEILHGWLLVGMAGTVNWFHEMWQAPNGAEIDVTFDSELRVTDKHFKEADLSLSGRVKRIVERVRSP